MGLENFMLLIDGVKSTCCNAKPYIELYGDGERGFVACSKCEKPCGIK